MTALSRRDILKGLPAALVIASISVDPQILESIPGTEVVKYLKRVRSELLDKIINPPRILEGKMIRTMPTLPWQEALAYVEAALQEYAS